MGDTRADATAAEATAPTGPPLLVLASGYLSVVVSLALVAADGIAVHAVGYLTGAMVPIVCVGLVRRIDLDRRRSASYRPRPVVRPALVVLGALALVAAGLHIWPIATELSR